MYIPHYYKEEDQSKLLDFIRAHSFGVLISGGDHLNGTHLPFLTEEKGTETVLVSHLAKANPQWEKFNDSNELLVIFTGPHGYVSPGNYEKQQNVPTWNYVAVHAYGKAKIIRGEDAAIAVLEKTIRNYEEAYFKQWEQLTEDYKMKMVKGIVAFEITVSKLEGKYKLSQNKTKKEQENVIHSFEKENNPELAELMKQNLNK